MCSLEGFDIMYFSSDNNGCRKIQIEPHFCRVYGDCGGGYSLEDAAKSVGQDYRDMAKELIEKAEKLENGTAAVFEYYGDT